MPDVLLPSLGADMDSGAVTEWRVAPGDRVTRGQIVAVIETDKADVEIESFEDGVVEEALVQVGERIKVGTPILRLAASTPTPGRAPARVAASPRARRAAAEHGVDLGEITGTGPGGMITAADVSRAATSPSPVAQERPAPVRPKPLGDDAAAAMRRAIGAAMSHSNREIPHYYLARSIDMSRATSWLAERNADRAIVQRVLLPALLARAVAGAAGEIPEMNGHYGPDGFSPSPSVHLGMAVSLRGGGLVAPAIHDAGALRLDELMAALRDLVARARAGTLHRAELTEPTITLTSLGDTGADVLFGVIPPPQVALVGMGAVVERPWAEAGMVGVRPILTVTLAADHRVSDGLRGAAFLAAINRLLQDPEGLA